MCPEFLDCALYWIRNKKPSLQPHKLILANVTQRLTLKKRLHRNSGSTQQYRLTTTSPRETFSTFHLFVHCFSRTCFLHIWKVHISCTSLSSTVPHSHCQHYWYYLSQPFDTDHMFRLLVNIYFYSLIDVIRCKSGSGHYGPFCLRLQ